MGNFVLQAHQQKQEHSWCPLIPTYIDIYCLYSHERSQWKHFLYFLPHKYSCRLKSQKRGLTNTATARTWQAWVGWVIYGSTYSVWWSPVFIWGLCCIHYTKWSARENSAWREFATSKSAVCRGNHYCSYLGLDLISLWLLKVCYPACAKLMPCSEIVLLPLTK